MADSVFVACATSLDWWGWIFCVVLFAVRRAVPEFGGRGPMRRVLLSCGGPLHLRDPSASRVLFPYPGLRAQVLRRGTGREISPRSFRSRLRGSLRLCKHGQK